MIKYGICIFFLLWYGTYHVDKTEKSQPLIRFINRPDKELVTWGKDWISHDSIYLNVDTSCSLYTIDSNTVLLCGSFMSTAATVQSVLLKSTNGGKTWKEVMKPLASIHLEKMFFVNEKTGYVVGDWATESTGEELVLYKTVDAGSTWKKLPPFKKPHYTCVCGYMGVENDSLTIYTECQGGTPNDGLYGFVANANATRWREKSRKLYEFSLDEEDTKSPEQPNHFNDPDGSVWKISQCNNKICISKKKNNQWEIVSKLPTLYKWDKGILRYK